MSAIGGIFQLSSQSLDPMLPISMSRSMMLRGSDQRGAYIKKSAAVLQNRRIADEPSALFRPLTRRSGGFAYTIVADGIPRGSELSREEGVLDPAEQALECYMALGTDFASILSGSFSLAILDEKRQELILLRDKKGTKPLFYVADRERIAFASEIKGLLRFFTDGIPIDRNRLWAYLTAPCGSIAGDTLYEGLLSLPPSSGAVCSAMGIARFSYDYVPVFEPTAPSPEPTAVTSAIPDADGLKRVLTDILFAFDYPQFDHLMPALIGAARQARGSLGRQSFVAEDATLCMDIGYAEERADRLGALCGVSITPVVPREYIPKDREQKKLDRLLRELWEDSDRSLLRHLFGDERLLSVERERNLAKRIRLRGMLLQIPLWAEHYPLIFP